jgi:hypothetical protein
MLRFGFWHDFSRAAESERDWALAPVTFTWRGKKTQELKPNFLLGFYGPTKVVP